MTYLGGAGGSGARHEGGAIAAHSTCASATRCNHCTVIPGSCYFRPVAQFNLIVSKTFEQPSDPHGECSSSTEGHTVNYLFSVWSQLRRELEGATGGLSHLCVRCDTDACNISTARLQHPESNNLIPL
eukprot:3076285-Rhodomonas_salina.2